MESLNEMYMVGHFILLLKMPFVDFRYQSENAWRLYTAYTKSTNHSHMESHYFVYEDHQSLRINLDLCL